MGIKLISGTILTTVLIGTVTAFAHPPCGGMPHLQPPSLFECNQPPPPPLPSELPAAVRDQVEDLLDAGQVTDLPLLQKLQKSCHALRKVSHKRPFDEAAVTALAKDQVAVQAELLVSRLRTQSRIRDLLEKNRPPQK